MCAGGWVLCSITALLFLLLVVVVLSQLLLSALQSPHSLLHQRPKRSPNLVVLPPDQLGFFHSLSVRTHLSQDLKPRCGGVGGEDLVQVEVADFGGAVDERGGRG